MANNDFVKQIILKFKTEGSDQVKKVAESMGKNFNSREVDRFLKSMEQLNSKMGKVGGGMSVELKKVTEYFKELNNQHFTKAERNLDRLGRLLKNQLDNLEKLKREGAAADIIAQRESTMRRTAIEFERIQSETPAPTTGGLRGALLRAGGGAGGRMGMAIGALNIAGAALQAVGGVAGAYKDYRLQEIQNRAAVADRFKQNVFDVFNGNMERAVLYSDPRRANEILKTQKSLNRAADIEAGIKTVGGTVLGIGSLLSAAAVGAKAGAIGGTVFGGPIGTLIGGIVGGGMAIGGAYLAGRSALGGAQYFRGGGRQEQQMQNRQAAETEARSTTLTPEYYKYFAERAESRYQYQRQLQMGDIQALEFRKQMRNAGVLDEGEMANTAMQFRRFGTRNAKNLAVGAAELAKAYGQDLGTTTNIMSQIASSVRGGPESAKREMIEAFRVAVKNGVNDSALIEEYTKQSAALLEISKGRMDMTQAGDQLNRFITGGATQRDIEGARGAMAAFGRTISGATGLMQQKKTAGILDLARGENGQVDMLTFKILSQMTDEQLATMTPERMAELGISKDKYDKFVQQQIQGTRRSGVGAKQAASLLEKAKTEGVLTVGEQEKLATAYGMSDVSSKTPEQIRGFLKGVLQNESALSKEQFENLRFEGRAGKDGFKQTFGMQAISALSLEDVEQNIRNNTTGTSAGVAVGAKVEGQNKLDELVYQNIQQNMGAINEIFKKQAETIKNQVDSDVISRPIEEIGKAADDIAQALRDASATIRGMPSTTRSSSQKAGEGR
jgi:hypothetical protein